MPVATDTSTAGKMDALAIAASFTSAVSAQQIFYYPTTSTITLPSPSDPSGTLSHTLSLVPSKASKPEMASRVPDLVSVPKRDPLSPPYKQGELITSLGPSYSLVNNLHSIMVEQAMLIYTPSDQDQWRSQALNDWEEPDMEVALRLVQAYAEHGRKAVVFFNGGPLTGASQPHFHIQSARYDTLAQGAPLLDRAASFHASTSAVALVDYAPFILPAVPHVVYTHALPSSPSAPTLLAALHSTLAHIRSHLASGLVPDPFAQTPNGTQGDPTRLRSFNLVLTRRWLHVIPRRVRGIDVPKTRESQREWFETFNALPVAGWWHVADEEEAERLAAFGVDEILATIGYRRTEWPAGELP